MHGEDLFVVEKFLQVTCKNKKYERREMLQVTDPDGNVISIRAENLYGVDTTTVFYARKAEEKLLIITVDGKDKLATFRPDLYMRFISESELNSGTSRNALFTSVEKAKEYFESLKAELPPETQVAWSDEMTEKHCK